MSLWMDNATLFKAKLDEFRKRRQAIPGAPWRQWYIQDVYYMLELVEMLMKHQLDHQRMWDLVRYQRQELHVAGLITDAEYAELAQDHSAVKRLESYEEIRQRLAIYEKELPNG